MLSGAVLVVSAGCAETSTGDLAMAEVQRLRAEVRSSEARVAAMEARQMYVVQQLSLLSGIVGTLGRDAAARAEELARKQDEVAGRVERIERAAEERALAGSPRAVASRAQALVDAGVIKVTVQGGRARLDVVGEAGAAGPSRGPGGARDLEDPFEVPRRATPGAKGMRRTDDLGF